MRQVSRARHHQIGFTIILASGLVLSGCASKPGSDALPPPPPPPPMAPPPPPPPPPPPAMAYPAPMMAEAVVSGRATSKSAPVPGSAYIPPVVVPTEPDNERYDGQEVNPVKQVASEPVSTFSVDVDTGAYANMRRFLNSGLTPPRDAVRTEEFINYFRYDYAKPDSKEAPFSLTTDMAVTPWNSNTRLLRIGLRGYDIPHASRPPANLVFLLDVSGSMGDPDKLPLLKSALTTLTNELGPRDKVSIVVYAGAAGLVLEPTSDKAQIRRALDQLSAGGSTAGGAGIQLAYQVAQDNRIEGGVNRVILATDGDFNVGTTDTKSLIELVERNRDSGVTLTTLGFGQGNYNEALMEQVADHGNGNYAYIDSATEAQKVLSDEMSSTLFTIAGDVKIQVEFNPSFVSEYRLIGYENRILRREDFNNDKVDAGDIGAGHQVTALYEIVPAGTKGWADPLRYSENPPAMGPKGSEFGFVKLRYKLPGQSQSILIDRPLSAAWLAGAAAPRGDFAFATAVAAFGQKLRGDSLLGSYSFGDIEKLAGPQSNFWRQEFVKLVQIAEGQTGR